MVFSKACNYGIRAVLYIATQKDRQYISIREISKKLNISFHFLTKILQILTQHKILVSVTGPKGGVALAHSTSETNLLEIINAIDGLGFFENCLLGLEECDNAHPCPIHQEWGDLRERIQSFLKDTSLAEMASKVQTSGFRLSMTDID